MQNPPPNQQGYGYQNPYGNPPPGGPLATPPGGKTSMGMEANLAALLSYVLTWVTGLVFFLLEKENRFVRFHAMQAVLFGAAWVVVAIVLSMLGIMLAIMDLDLLWLLFSPVRLILWLGFVAVWIVCMVKAYQGKMFRLPVIGGIAENIVNK
ncbi:MAG TPA: DUF4870 domain-containing protein [Pyrinomonadaceae bacterium]|nr:DUF4870 domain-containing protein [Pyrinomonadaceae bacterium]